MQHQQSPHKWYMVMLWSMWPGGIFYLLFFMPFWSYKHEGHCQGNISTQKEHTMNFLGVEMCVCACTCRIYRGGTVTHLLHELVLYHCHWGTCGTQAPMSHLSAVFACMHEFLCFLCELADEINITCTCFCLSRSWRSVVIRRKHPCMSWGTNLACDGLHWK